MDGTCSEVTGRKMEVQEWDKLRNNLILEFDSSPDLFSSVIHHSRYYIQGGHCPQTGEEYFVRLENNMLLEDMLNFLIALTDELCLHRDMGMEKVADTLRIRKEELVAYRKKQQLDEKEDINFVGREKDIKNIKKILLSDCPGVCICGLGGLGKSSLARKICGDMDHKYGWDIGIVDLKEKKTLLDVLRSIFDDLPIHDQTLIEETEEGIMQQIRTILEKNIKKKTIIVLDNLDDVLTNGKEGDKFKNKFLKPLGVFLQEFGDDCKIKVLMTSRLKLTLTSSSWFWSLFRKDSQRAFGVFLEEELLPMEPSDALELYKKSLHTVESGAEAETIIKLCGYSPLAITTLCSSIRYRISKQSDVLESLKPGLWTKVTRGTPSISECLEKTFISLDEEVKRYFVQLCVFHTASFDLRAAVAVFGEKEVTPGIYDGGSTQQKLLNLHSRHLVEVHKDIYSSEVSDFSNVRFSLHPVVFNLLKRKVKQYQNDFNKAKGRFITYFRKFVCNVAEETSRDCMKGQKTLGKDRVHVKNFYEILAGPEAPEIPNNLEAVVENRRIYQMADLLLYDETKWNLVQNCVKQTKNKKNTQLGYIFWRLCEATLFIDLDRNQEVKRIIDELESSFPTLRENEAKKAVLGGFYFTKGRYLFREYECDEAIQSLTKAEKLIRTRGVKEKHIVLLANILNAMGCAYFRKDNTFLEKAAACHKEAIRTIKKCSPKGMNVEVPMYLQNLGKCWYEQGMDLKNIGREADARKKYQEALEKFDNGVRLDIKMNLHKMDCHAVILCNRGEVHAALENFENAEKDIGAALILRRDILSYPHLNITLVTYKMALVLYKKGVYLYQQKQSETAAWQAMSLAAVQFERVAKMVKDGGLPKKHKDYPDIKKHTFELLIILQKWRKLGDIYAIYQKFENGDFRERIHEKRSIAETTKFSLMPSQPFSDFGSESETDCQLERMPSSIYDPDKVNREDFEAVSGIVNRYKDPNKAAIDFTRFIQEYHVKPKAPMQKPRSTGNTFEKPAHGVTMFEGAKDTDVFANPMCLSQESDETSREFEGIFEVIEEDSDTETNLRRSTKRANETCQEEEHSTRPKRKRNQVMR